MSICDGSVVPVRGPSVATSLVAALVALLVAIPVALAEGQSDNNASSNIPVLIVIEDEDPDTVVRSSDIYKRVIAELRISMQFYGFRTLDEESIAADLGWTIGDRRSKAELIERIKLMNKSDEATHQVRAWVLFRVRAKAKSLRYSTVVDTRIDGEIYDADTNQFLDGFEMPLKEYPAPQRCLQERLCIHEVVGEKAREIATSLGDILAIKLERYSPPRTVESGAVAVRPAPWLGKPRTYTLRMVRFDRGEAVTIVGVMTDEFPGFMSVETISQDSAVRRYSYQSRASAAKLEEWLYILLEDMGFDADKGVLVQFHENTLSVIKMLPTPNRPESEDERQRFR